jgi:hypothetical protein
MIPYDDLVAALAEWRARKGLPIADGAGAAAATTAAPGSGKVSRPRSTPPAAPQPRAASPQPPPTAAVARKPAPPPLAAPDELDVDEAALLDEQAYDNEGADFALNFGSDDGATSVGGPPHRDSVTTDPVGAPAAPRRRGRRDDEW